MSESSLLFNHLLLIFPSQPNPTTSRPATSSPSSPPSPYYYLGYYFPSHPPSSPPHFSSSPRLNTPFSQTLVPHPPHRAWTGITSFVILWKWWSFGGWVRKVIFRRVCVWFRSFIGLSFVMIAFWPFFTCVAIVWRWVFVSFCKTWRWVFSDYLGLIDC